MDNDETVAWRWREINDDGCLDDYKAGVHRPQFNGFDIEPLALLSAVTSRDALISKLEEMVVDQLIARDEAETRALKAEGRLSKAVTALDQALTRIRTETNFDRLLGKTS